MSARWKLDDAATIGGLPVRQPDKAALSKSPKVGSGHAPNVSVASGPVGNPNPATVDLDVAGLGYPRLTLSAHSLAPSVCCWSQQSVGGGLMSRESSRSISGVRP